MTEAYPLHWPIGYSRTQKPANSSFRRTFADARDLVLDEIKRFTGSNLILSTNIPLRRDGIPYGNYGKLEDNGVAVYFTYKSNQVVFACDKWTDVADNMNAIALTLKAIRDMDRWGVSDMINRTFTGFKALPEKSDAKTWYQILGVAQDAGWEMVKSSYRELIKKYHPDMSTGDQEKYIQVDNAFKEATKIYRK